VRVFEFWFGNRRDPYTWLSVVIMGVMMTSVAYWQICVCVVLYLSTALVRRWCPWSGESRTTVGPDA